MQTTDTELWLCDDCAIAATNNDYTGLDYWYDPDNADLCMSAIKSGLERLGPHLVYEGEQDDFSRRPCDCCGTPLHGARTLFTLLTP